MNANLGLSSDTYWDVGLDFNYKAVTLDLRYWGTNIKPDVPPATQRSAPMAGSAATNSAAIALRRDPEVRHHAVGS